MLAFTYFIHILMLAKSCQNWCWHSEGRFNNMVCPQGLSLPLGVNLAARSDICPRGGMFTPSFTPRGEHSLLFWRMEGRIENFTPGGQLSPYGSKFAPRGEVKNGPLRPIVHSHFKLNTSPGLIRAQICCCPNNHLAPLRRGRLCKQERPTQPENL
jgi:hypothetical protein